MVSSSAQRIEETGDSREEVESVVVRFAGDSGDGMQITGGQFTLATALVSALVDWVQLHDEFADLIELLPEPSTPEEADTTRREGSVYLLMSGAYYKIGRSDNIEQRVREIRVSLPEEVTLVHTIRTDDPPGIEAYWHRRFAEQRAHGEWFRLSAADLRAFKRRRFQ